MNQSLRILVIDDSRIVRMKLASLLEANDVTVLEAEDAVQGTELIRRETPDCLLLDYQLPGVNGLEFLATMRADKKCDWIPVVMVTGEGSESIAVEAMKIGAQDYLVKNEITTHNLHRAIANAIEKVAAARELVAKNKRIEQLTEELMEANGQLALLSRLDPLTKLFNRRVFEESIALEHERSVRHKQVYSVIMIDIDHFKQFNDTLGHQAGDECLQRVAQCLSDSLRNMDIVGRYGGEEFIILAPQSSLATGHILANRVRAQIQDLNITHKASGTAEMVTISLGVAEGPAEQWEDVVKKADEALYTAKKNGRNRVCVYETELSGASSASNKIPA